MKIKIKVKDLSKTLKNYSSVWLALEQDTSKVVASGKAPADVLRKARSLGIAHPVLTRAPKSYGAYIL